MPAFAHSTVVGRSGRGAIIRPARLLARLLMLGLAALFALSASARAEGLLPGATNAGVEVPPPAQAPPVQTPPVEVPKTEGVLGGGGESVQVPVTSGAEVTPPSAPAVAGAGETAGQTTGAGTGGGAGTITSGGESAAGTAGGESVTQGSTQQDGPLEGASGSGKETVAVTVTETVNQAVTDGAAAGEHAAGAAQSASTGVAAVSTEAASGDGEHTLAAGHDDSSLAGAGGGSGGSGSGPSDASLSGALTQTRDTSAALASSQEPPAGGGLTPVRVLSDVLAPYQATAALIASLVENRLTGAAAPVKLPVVAGLARALLMRVAHETGAPLCAGSGAQEVIVSGCAVRSQGSGNRLLLAPGSDEDNGGPPAGPRPQSSHIAANTGSGGADSTSGSFVGGSSSAASGAPGFGTTALLMLASLLLLGSPCILRRLAIVCERWLAASFALIPERPG